MTTKKQRGPAATYEDPKTLVPWPGNPRQNDAAVDEVAASIREFGFGAPIVARLANREIIVGHTRWRAAVEKLDLAEVPVRFLDVDETTAHKLALADNRTGEIALWDDAKLSAALRELADEGGALDLPGFDDAEIANLIAAATPALPAAERVNDPKTEWRGMPEYQQADLTSARKIIVHFTREADVVNFAALVKQRISDRTRFIWYPAVEIDDGDGRRYIKQQ